MSPKGKPIKRLVNFTPDDIQIVRGYAEQLGLSEEKGFSAALRIIIREWDKLTVSGQPELCRDEEQGDQG